MNYFPLKILFNDVASEVSEEVSYFLAEDESFASRRILAPVRDTDCKLLVSYWNEAAAWLASALSDIVSVELIDGASDSESFQPEPSLVIHIPDVIEVENHKLISATGCRALAAHIGSNWLLMANRLSCPQLSSRAEVALLSLKSMLRPRTSLFPRARITLHPF